MSQKNIQKRKIALPPISSFDHWPEKPFRWMLTGLIKTMGAVEGADANYLVALGLVCYTEFMGHEVRKFKNLPYGMGYGKESFNTFLGEYMEYKEMVKQYPDIYSWYRCGLCHEFRIKLDSGGLESGPYHFFDGTEAEIETLKNNYQIDVTKGIAINPSNGKRLLLIEPYLKDFAKGVEKFLKESGQIS